MDTTDYGDVIMKAHTFAPNPLPIKIYEGERATGRLRVVAGSAARLEALGLAFDPNTSLTAINEAGTTVS